MNSKYIELISINENNENLKVKDKLQKTLFYIKNKYNVDVELSNHIVTIEEEVAKWKKGVLSVDARKRGILGTLFIISHVFGHLIQFSSNIDYSELLSLKDGEPPLNLSEEFKKRYFLFEKEAFQIGKGLMMNAFKFDSNLDLLYTAFMYTDYEHYWNYLVTGKTNSIDNFNKKWMEIINQNINESIPPIFSNIGISRGKIDVLSIDVV